MTQFAQLPYLPRPRYRHGDRGTKLDWARKATLAAILIYCYFTAAYSPPPTILLLMATILATGELFALNPPAGPYTGRAMTQSPGDSAATRLQLTALGCEVLEIDGTSITDLESLVAAVGNALGPIQFPEDPAERLRTLLGFEQRDLVPHKALIWNHAAAFAEHEPNTFAWFLAEWRSMARHNDNMRLLVVEAPPAVVQRAEQLADSVTLKRLRQLMQHAPTFRA